MTQFTDPVQIDDKLWMIDLMEQGLPCRSAAYFLAEEKPTLIETGSAKSHDIIVEALQQLGYTPEDLAYVIVTHVHLDHAGGAGHMMQKAKNAQLVVQNRAARHMIDPSRLWNGAKAVYGDQLEELFGEMIAVPESQVLVRKHGETLDLGGRVLTFYDTPGHAKHHFSIHDPVADGVYAGDAAGIRYRTCFTGWDFEWVMPSTSPVDFDPEAVHQTVELLESIPFQWIYHTHFGRSPKAEALRDTDKSAQSLAALIESIYRGEAAPGDGGTAGDAAGDVAAGSGSARDASAKDAAGATAGTDAAARDATRDASAKDAAPNEATARDVTLEEVVNALRGWIREDLKQRGHTVSPTNPLHELDLDVVLDALGLMHYATVTRK
jgi:glyoxylase-like metal-dependent hydrolase (beta-lactamase superfamily II)